MAGSFIQTAAKQVTDVTTFLKEASSSGIKYVAERGKSHRVFIPTRKVEKEVDGQVVTTEGIIAISAKTHDWTTAGGKYGCTVCLHGVVMENDNGIMVNDGSCPFCNRVNDAWDIYNYRYQHEEETCKLTGENRKKHLENCKANFSSEMKAKKAVPYAYILVAKFKTNDDGTPVLSQDRGLPVYELKVMKLSQSRLEKIQNQLRNSGIEFAGSELIFQYADTDDKRQQVGQSTVSPIVADNMKFTAAYQGLLDMINSDVEKFKWEGIEEAFQEWKGMTTAEANNTVNALFSRWDEYKQAQLINPNAKYMEYEYNLQPSMPELGVPVVPSLTGVAQPVVPSAVNMPNMGVEQPVQDNGNAGMPVVPNIPNSQSTMQIPNGQESNNGVAMTANSLLGGMSSGTTI